MDYINKKAFLKDIIDIYNQEVIDKIHSVVNDLYRDDEDIPVTRVIMLAINKVRNGDDATEISYSPPNPDLIDLKSKNISINFSIRHRELIKKYEDYEDLLNNDGIINLLKIMYLTGMIDSMLDGPRFSLKEITDHHYGK